MTARLLAGSGIGVHQRRKLFELRNQYELTDETGAPAGAVTQVDQSPFTMLARVFSDLDVALPVTLEVTDVDGGPVLRLHKPWFRYAISVTSADGAPLGSVRKRIRLGKAGFDVLGSDGQLVGHARAQDWRARDFAVTDPAGADLARITKRWRGLATELFTDADSYAVTFETGTDGTQRLLALAAALSVDLTMKQKDYG